MRGQVKIRAWCIPKRIYRFRVLKIVGRVAKLRCECGTRLEMRVPALARGHKKSCGCWKQIAAQRQIAKNRPAINPRLTHGGTTPELLPLYRVYRRMLQRCYNPRVHNFKNYGGRGIRVADEWLGATGFSTWLRDMGPRPKKMTLDRIDVDKNYEKSNTRWASMKTQRLNQRRMKKIA